MSFPFIQQFDRMDCGPTCLAMICKFYGKPVPVQFLREKAQTGKEGVNLLGIGEAAESIGFRTRAVRLSLTALTNHATLPAILHWNQNHFVILHKISRRKFYIADPGKGLITYSTGDFNQQWVSSRTDQSEEGIALLLEPTAAFHQYDFDMIAPTAARADGLAFKNIVSYIYPHKKLIVQLLIGLGLASLLQLILPFLTQSIVDVGVSTANLHFVYIVLLAQLALFIGRLVIDVIRSWILLHMSTRINVSILTDFLIKLMRLPVSFFDSKKTGDILQRMNDHQRIEAFLTGSSLNVLFSLTNLVIFSIVLAVFNVYIFSAFATASILYSSWVILFQRKRKILDYKRFDMAAREQSATIQLVQGMQEIKLHGCERNMRWGWERLQAKIYKLSMQSLRLNQWQQSGAFFINEGKNIFITFLSARAVIEGQMTLGAMLSVQYIIGQLNSPIEQMIGFVQSWQNARISMDRLNEIHGIEDEEPSYKSFVQDLPESFTRAVTGGNAVTQNPDILSQSHPPSPIPHSYTPGEDMGTDDPVNAPMSITFSNVSFTYPGAGNDPILKNIDLHVQGGKTTAIVGVSGSGKTTLLKLLLKFYQPGKGEIKIGDTGLENISHRVWRRHCGVVMQESFIFSDSIGRNIAVGEERINMKKIREAISIANLKEFIDALPLGINTKIGPEGTGISMGQRQRILIARAIYRNPDFIFFDEATNSLDANNESAINRHLESFFKGRTVLVVAHRLSTVRHADKIVVINNGMIVEQGCHHELVGLKGVYYTLVKNQLEVGE